MQPREPNGMTISNDPPSTAKAPVHAVVHTADDATDKMQLAAWKKVCEALIPLPKDRKKRVLEAAAIIFDVE